MARIRTVKPEFWKDEELALLPREFRLFYIALWNEADDEGRCRANPGYLKGVIFPYDDDFNIHLALQSLEQLNKIQLYESDKGEELLVIRHLNKHQKIDKRYPSKLPPPPRYKKKAIPNKSRIELAERLGASWPRKRRVRTKCLECGQAGIVCWMTKRWVCFDGLEVDHKIPEVSGGSSLSSNLQLLCRPCNRRKPDKLPPIPAEQSAGAAESPQEEQGTGNREQVEERTVEQGEDRGVGGRGLLLSNYQKSSDLLLSAGVAKNNIDYLAKTYSFERIRDVVLACREKKPRNRGGWIYGVLKNQWDVGNGKHK